MPIIYIHGVNTRLGYNYQKDLAARKKLLEHFILEPLKLKGDRFKRIDIVNPYWGNYGVDFKWGLESVPNVRIYEALGTDDDDAVELDVELAEMINALAEMSQSSPSQLEPLGQNDSRMKRAIEKDLTHFIEIVLFPLLVSEMSLTEDAEENPDKEGTCQAQLAIASEKVSKDPILKSELATANSDQEIMDLLKDKILEQYEQLFASQQTIPSNGRWEALGQNSLEDIKNNVEGVFTRVINAPSRALTLSALELFRSNMHREISRFIGDVFVYLNERGDKAEPGPIISTVLNAINNTPRHHSNEPLIIITHSMGGNILYDILTYYAPDLKIDVWVSVAGQVAQFEEMKLFKGSNKKIAKPQKVLKPHVGYWLNVYDPADVFGFKTSPVFAGVDADQEYLTGVNALKAHGAYFGRASFYMLIQEHITKVLQ